MPWPRRFQRPPVETVLLYLFTALTVFLAVQSFMHENYSCAPGTLLWKLKLLKVSDALLILVTLLGVLVARKQLEVGAKPGLTNVNGGVPDSTMGLIVESGKLIWRSSVKNTGTAGAIIRNVSYWVSFTAVDPKYVSDYPLDFQQAVSVMEQKGFLNGRDFALLNISRGAVIGSQSEHVLLEMGAEVIAELKALDMKIEYTGPLGGFYQKEIKCVPRDTIAQRVPAARLSNTTT